MLNLIGVIFAGLVTAQVHAGSDNASVHTDIVKADNAYVRMPIPGRSMSAAFMTLENITENKQVLTHASAAWAKSIEIHTHTHENGVMKMREIPALALPVGQAVTLQPGGLHLMLFGLDSALPETPEISLCFESGSCQTITTTLRDMRK